MTIHAEDIADALIPVVEAHYPGARVLPIVALGREFIVATVDDEVVGRLEMFPHPLDEAELADVFERGDIADENGVVFDHDELEAAVASLLEDAYPGQATTPLRIEGERGAVVLLDDELIGMGGGSAGIWTPRWEREEPSATYSRRNQKELT